MAMETETFTFHHVGTTGCEIVGPDDVIGWTVDLAWASLIVTLLNGAEYVSLGRLHIQACAATPSQT
jgi:hypothetical protein